MTTPYSLPDGYHSAGEVQQQAMLDEDPMLCREVIVLIDGDWVPKHLSEFRSVRVRCDIRRKAMTCTDRDRMATVPDILSKMTGLRWLDMRGQDWLEGVTFHLPPSLISLDCSKCQRGIGWLEGVTFHLPPSLISLDCSECWWAEDDLFDHLEGLEHLKCKNCEQLTKRAFRRLVNLISLDCTGCDRLIGPVFSSMTQLKGLDCRWCRHISGRFPSSLVDLVDCDGCPKVTDDSFEGCSSLMCITSDRSMQLTSQCYVHIHPDAKIKIGDGDLPRPPSMCVASASASSSSTKGYASSSSTKGYASPSSTSEAYPQAKCCSRVMAFGRRVFSRHTIQSFDHLSTE